MSCLRRALRHAFAVAAAGTLTLLAVACGPDLYPQTIFHPVTDYGRQLNDLFADVFWWTIWILILVELGLVYILFRFRDREGAPEPKRIYGNNKLELLWTVIPAVIVVAITVPSVRTIFHTYQKAPQDALVVQAIGHQWWWEFKYPQYGPTARTSNQLYLPVGRPVEVVLTSVDVIHSWWVPRLGGKRDNFPIPAQPEGATEPTRYHRLLFTPEETGEYSGQCAEYCGEEHALMRMRVVVVEPQAFQEFITQVSTGQAPTAAGPAPVQAGVLPAAGAGAAPSGQGPAQPDTAAAAAQAAAPARPGAPQEGTPERQGYDVFMSHACVACHRIAGTSAPGLIGPDLTKIGARWAIGAGTLPNTPDNITRWIMNPQAIKPGAMMPGANVPGGGIPATGLTEEQARQIAAYLSSLK